MSRGVKVLVVDDDMKIGSIFKKGLEKEGFEVDYVSNGSDAIKRAGAVKYDIIFLDMIMEDLNGVDVLEGMKGKGMDASIVMITGNNVDKLMCQAMRSGAKGFLIKPITISQVVDVVRNEMKNRLGAVRALVLDESERLGRMFRDALEEEGGVADYATSKTDALEKVTKHKYEIIFMDVLMFGMDAVDTLRKIRQINKDVKVVMLTGFSVTEFIKKARSYGVLPA